MTTKKVSMVNKAIAFCLLVFAPALLAPIFCRELSRYDETVVLAADGSAEIRLSLTFADRTESGVLIPVRHAALLNLNASGMAKGAVRRVENKGNYFLALDFAGTGANPAAIEISFQVKNYFEDKGASSPFGNKELGYRFVNVSFERIGKLSAKLVLPAGFVINGIGNFSPKPQKSGMALPYTISRQDGKDVAGIAVDNVKLGDEITLHCTFKSTKKSLPLLLFLIALAIAYLVFFRDILKNGKNAAGSKP